MVQIKEIEASETYNIRKEMLRKDIPLTEEIKGDFDKTTLHLGAFVDDKLVCVATFLQNDFDIFKGLQYRLAGMATLNEYQKRGIGQEIIFEALKVLKKKNVDILWCNARIVALNFYRKIGFSVEGETFDIPLIGEHYIMFKKIKYV